MLYEICDYRGFASFKKKSDLSSIEIKVLWKLIESVRMERIYAYGSVRGTQQCLRKKCTKTCNAQGYYVGLGASFDIKEHVIYWKYHVQTCESKLQIY
jgi:hypothetical protein